MAGKPFNAAVANAGIAKLVKLSTRMIDSLFTALDKSVSPGFMSELEKNVSFTDHTLAQLRQMDHPYAVRHGSIQIHTNQPWIVHIQKQGILGTFSVEPKNSLAQYKSDFIQKSVSEGAIPKLNDSGQGTLTFRPGHTGSFDVTFNVKTDSDVSVYLEQGTNRMLKRDYIEHSMESSEKPIVDLIQQRFKVYA